MDLIQELQARGVSFDIQIPKKKKKVWKEHDHAKRLAKWVREKRPDLMLVKITNEGQRSMADAARTHSEGTVRGFPDYLVIAPNLMFFIELKSETGRLRPEQREVHTKIELLGHTVFTCRGWQAARDIIIEMTV